MTITAQTVRQLFLTENATLKVTNNNLATDSVNPKRTHGGTIGNSIYGQQGLKAEYNFYDLVAAVIADVIPSGATPTFAEVLADDNSTGANDIVIDLGQFISSYLYALNSESTVFVTEITNGVLTANRAVEFPNASGVIELVRYITVNTPTVHTATTGEVIDVTTGASDLVVQLPSATIINQVITILKADGGAGKVKITPEGIETINGAATFDLNLQDDGAKIISTGTEWRVIGIA